MINSGHDERSGTNGRLGSLWSLYPLAFGGAFALAGICLAELSEINVHFYWLLVAAASGMALSWICKWVWLTLLSTSLLFAGLHLKNLANTRDHPLRLQLTEWNQPVGATIWGRLIPERREMDEAGQKTAILLAERIEIRNYPNVPFHSPTRLHVILSGMEITEAAQVRCAGRLFLPRDSSLPGGFDREKQLWRDGFVSVLRLDRLEEANPPQWSDASIAWLLRASDQCRDWIAQQLTMDLDDAPDQMAIILGMMLGDPGRNGLAVEKDFRDAGTQHLFAVSGLHVGLIAMVIWALSRALPLHRNVRIVGVIILVMGYAFVTGWSPSAARAAWMIAMMLSAGLFVRRPNLINSLGAAFLLLLWADTHQLFRPGFQLSFGVLLSIILIVPWALKRVEPLIELDPFVPRQLARPLDIALLRSRQSLASTGIVSMTAWLGSMPLMWWHFDSVTPIGILANCLLMPLAFVELLTSCLSLCAAAVGFVGLQVMLNNANWFFASVTLSLTGNLAELPGARFTIASSSVASPAGIVAEGTFFNLPNGGAAMFTQIGEKAWLWDTGSRENFEFTIGPWLERRGVTELDGLIVSHNDTSHIGGASVAAALFEAKRVIHCLHEPWKYDSGASAMPTLLQGLHQPAQRVGKHDHLELGHLPFPDGPASFAHAEVLYPDADHLCDRADDRALVWKMKIGPLRVLLLTDAGFETEKTLLESGIDLHCDLLIHTQHGTDPGGLAEFLLRVRPQLVITANEFHLPEDQPPLRWIDACRKQGVPRWNAREKGSIQWRVQADQSVEVHALGTGDRLVLKGDET